MDWKVTAALALLGLAILAGLMICIVSSVNLYAKRFAEEPEDKRRGFEVKTTPTAGDTQSAAQREKDDHHG